MSGNETPRLSKQRPAEDHSQKRIDLNDVLIHQPDATFYIRVHGESMGDVDINDGNHVIVERTLEPRHGDIVMAVVDNEFTIKTLYKRRGTNVRLVATPTSPDTMLRDGQELII